MNNIIYNPKPGQIFDSINGPFEFVEELPPKYTYGTAIRYCKIRFVNTGTVKEVKLQSIFNSNINIKDPYFKSVVNVGYLGDTSNIQYTKKEYDMWRNMILRCYDRTNNAYKYYGDKGVTVCERWHCFANFITDLPSLPNYNYYIYNPSIFSLDKDTLSRGLESKIYSPETCMFLETDKNSRLDAHNDGNNYTGVHKLQNGNFQSRVMIDTEDYFLGTYDNEIAAANMYNYVIASSGMNTKINDVEYMPIEECLKHKNRNQPIKLPDRILNKLPAIVNYNNQANFKGVIQKNTHYLVEYFVDGKRYNGGKFIDKIAAANAYNYYASLYDTNGAHTLNNVQYMPPNEWIKHKYYGKNETPPVQMTTSTNEPDDVRRARCRAKYGIDFL